LAAAPSRIKREPEICAGIPTRAGRSVSTIPRIVQEAYEALEHDETMPNEHGAARVIIEDWGAGRINTEHALAFAAFVEMYGQICPPSSKFIDSARTFLSVEDSPAKYAIPEITPLGIIKNSHGDPRTMKSLGTAEEIVAAATCTPAYGLKRFTPDRAFRCLYCSQEDAAPRVRPRFRGLLKGRGIEAIPETLGFAVFKGIDFDNKEWQERFVNGVIDAGYELVAIDPIRGFTANADKGPSDVMPIVKAVFRPLTVKGITVHIVHHDTKPPSAGPDMRRRSHRASGGGWFSASECPVSFEKICEGRSLVTPEDFKFSSDPKPFTITYKEEGDKIWLIGEDSSADEAQTLAIDEKVISYLSEHPAASGSALAKAIHVRKDAVLDSTTRLFEAGKLDYAPHGKAKLWRIR
jgi:hypothetical protein